MLQALDLCEIFYSIDDLKLRLEAAGYVEGGDHTPYNKAAVEEMLQDRCEEAVLDHQILWWEKDGTEETIHLASPIMMACLIEKYEYIKPLLACGYKVKNHYNETQIYATNVGVRGKEFKYRKVSLEQFLLANELPVEVLELLFSAEEQVKIKFSFRKDYWENPYLVDDIYGGMRKGIPSLRGVEYAWKHFPEKFSDFILSSRGGCFSGEIRKTSARQRHQLLKVLLEIAKGKKQELVALFNDFKPTFYYDEFGNNQREIDYWLKNIPMLKNACGGVRECESFLFETLVTLMYELLDSSYDYEKGKKKERYEQLRDAIATEKPSHYTAENFLCFIYQKINKSSRSNGVLNWTDYIKIWKSIVKEPLCVERSSEILWRFLSKLFRNNDWNEEDYYDIYDDEDDEEEELTEEELFSFILFLEEIETIQSKQETKEEAMDRLIELVCGIMKLESEEVLLACLKNSLIQKEHVKACINTALKFGKTRLVPVLIMAQYEDEQGKKGCLL